MKFDDVPISNFSRRIVDKALQPRALANYILDYLDDEAEAADLLALRIAIDSRYPDCRERFERGERGDVAAELTIIEEMVKFHIGIAVGRRVR